MAGGRLQSNVSINDPSPNSVLVQAKTSLSTVYIQKIVYSPSAFVQGTVLSFIDSLTGQSIGLVTVVPPAVGLVTYTMDFSDALLAGTPLSKGASLVLSILSGGVVGRMHVKAYQLPLSPVVPSVAPMTAGFTK